MFVQNSLNSPGRLDSTSLSSTPVTNPPHEPLSQSVHQLGNSAQFSPQAIQASVPSPLGFDVQKVILLSLARQKAQLLGMPGPSHHVHVEALDELASRGGGNQIQVPP